MTDRPKVGLCLCGGGITGALYEVGCLAAFEEAFEDFSASQFDLFVGTAAGSTVALALAGGHSATRLYRALLDPSDDFFPLQRNHLLRLDLGEMRRMWGTAFGAARRLILSASLRPLELEVWNELDRFQDSLPAGLFTLHGYERFLEDFMRRRGIPGTFDEMGNRLLIAANDLDAGTRVVFGDGDLKGVGVARAAVASTAVSPFFAPVEINGRDYVDAGLGEVGHADLAVDKGCELVLIINPMVPLRSDPATRDVPTGHGKKRRVRDKGLLWVMNQSQRIRSEARFRTLVAHYRDVHPETSLLVLEPDEQEAKTFLYSPMNFAARRVILEDAYRSTLASLRRPDSPLAHAFLSRGIRPLRPSAPPRA